MNQIESIMIAKNTTNDQASIALSSNLYHLGNGVNEFLLIPDNKGELIIPFSGDINLKLIGTTKSVKLNADSCYFLKPRRRGMEILCNESSKLLISSSSFGTDEVVMFCAQSLACCWPR